MWTSFFSEATGGHPRRSRLLARFPDTRYNWLKRWMMRRIVAKAGGDTDTSRDYEYTDWEALRVFCEQFAKSITVVDPPVAASA